MSEAWRDIPGYEGHYQVSDLGRVRSLDMTLTYTATIKGKDVEVVRRHKGKVLSPRRKCSGGPNAGTYMAVNLFGKQFEIQGLVLRAFVGPRPDGTEALHNDGNASDNRLENLRWGTHKENINQAFDDGAIGLGERHHLAKYTDAQVDALRSKPPGETLKDAARRVGVAYKAAWMIFNGKCRVRTRAA